MSLKYFDIKPLPELIIREEPAIVKVPYRYLNSEGKALKAHTKEQLGYPYLQKKECIYTAHLLTIYRSYQSQTKKRL